MKKKLIWCLGAAMLLGSLFWTVGCLGSDLDYVTVGGEQRGYLLHLPKDHVVTVPTPLVLALHQFTDTPKGTEDLSGFSEVADRAGFIVAYPKGISRGWNAGMRGSPDDVAFIEALIDALSQQYNIDQDRIYACGLSAGGMMSQFLAGRTDRFAAIASIAGSLTKGATEGFTNTSPVPIMLIHGTDDPIVPFAGGETYAGPGMRPVFLSNAGGAAFWAARNGCGEGISSVEVPVSDPEDTTRVTKITYPCATGAEVVRYDIQGGGHTWPGRDNWYPAFIVGATSGQLDATEVIWSFFERHKRGE